MVKQSGCQCPVLIVYAIALERGLMTCFCAATCDEARRHTLTARNSSLLNGWCLVFEICSAGAAFHIVRSDLCMMLTRGLCSVSWLGWSLASKYAWSISRASLAELRYSSYLCAERLMSTSEHIKCVETIASLETQLPLSILLHSNWQA